MPEFHIVIVEDNTDLRLGLHDYLAQEGFRVTGLEDGEGLSAVIANNAPDAMLLDLNLPLEDGVDIIKRVKQAYPRMGIVVLTARVRSLDRKLAYEAGADVFLTKPAGADEVCTVITSLCQRIAPPSEDQDWTLQLLAQSLVPPHGHAIQLTGRECQLVHEMALSSQLIRFDRLNELLGDRGVSEQVNRIRIEQIISRVRQKLAPALDGAASIKVLRGKGYRLCIRIRVRT